MRMLVSFLVMVLAASSLSAAKVYRRDGSFIEFKKTPMLTARFVVRSELPLLREAKTVWRAEGRHLAIGEKLNGPLPVYHFGIRPYVANNQIFWRGNLPVTALAKKYGLMLEEIYPSTSLYRFRVKGDAVEVAQRIVEADDGFAFPDMIREQQFRAEPVMPIPDKYYKEGYQWALKNTGTAIGISNPSLPTKANADIRFEAAMAFIVEALAEEQLPNFDGATKVAIMDSGVDLTHPDLKNKLDEGWDAVNHEPGGDYGTIDPNDPYGTAGYSHGTNCAGVAAAEGNEIGTTGVCPWCGIYPVQFMEGGIGSASSEQGYIESYEKYVADEKIVAVNCSFGPMAGMGEVPLMPGEEESHLNFFQNGRGGKGGAILYASGNDGVDTNYMVLHRYEFKFKRDGVDVVDQVFSIGGTSAWDNRVSYSNYGQEIDMVTPTLTQSPLLGIATTYIQGYGDLDKDYSNQFSGTSAAAPFATGVMGVIFSVNPDLTLEEAYEIIKVSSDKINPETGFWNKTPDEPAGDAHSPKFGYGRANLFKAVRLAMGLEMCDPHAILEETKNGLDDDCDGWVDEGFAPDLSKVGMPCTTAADCVTADFGESDVQCLDAHGATKFTGGYCAVLPKKTDCPDGTRTPGDMGAYCLKDCNKEHKCTREGYYCTEENLGFCTASCKTNNDCTEGAYCDDEGHCRRNPSEPGGECETNEDCLYNGYCVTMVPGGFCFVQCANGIDDYCGDQGAKCVHVSIPQMGEMDMCVPPCTEDSDCRSMGGMQLKCHKNLNGKSDVCFMPCSTDDDCFDENAECDNGTCIVKGTGGDDEDAIVSDDDMLVGDHIAGEDEDELVDSLVVPDEESKKKDDGCGCSLVF